MFVSCSDNFFITHRTTRLNHRGDTRSRSRFDAVGEWEEGIGCHHGALRKLAGLLSGNANCGDPRHLTRTDADTPPKPPPSPRSATEFRVIDGERTRTDEISQSGDRPWIALPIEPEDEPEEPRR